MNFSEYYRAMETSDGKKLVYVCHVNLRPCGGLNIYYKDETEKEGPYIYNCPADILAIAEESEPLSEESKRWREKVHNVLDNKAKAKALKIGDVIKFNRKIQFGRNWEEDTFVVDKHPLRRGKTLRTALGKWVKIRNWRSIPFEIVK